MTLQLKSQQAKREGNKIFVRIFYHEQQERFSWKVKGSLFYALECLWEGSSTRSCHLELFNLERHFKALHGRKVTKQTRRESHRGYQQDVFHYDKERRSNVFLLALFVCFLLSSFGSQRSRQVTGSFNISFERKTSPESFDFIGCSFGGKFAFILEELAGVTTQVSGVLFAMDFGW